MSLGNGNASDEVERLARELAAETGEPVVTAVVRALAERLERERQRRLWLAYREEPQRITSEFGSAVAADASAAEGYRSSTGW